MNLSKQDEALLERINLKLSTMAKEKAEAENIPFSDALKIVGREHPEQVRERNRLYGRK